MNATTGNDSISRVTAVPMAYAVTLRCESLVAVPRGQWHDLPPIPSECGPLYFRIQSEYRPCDDGTEYPSHLFLRVVVPAASSLKHAEHVAQHAGSWLSPFIALAHNAYLGPPSPWVTYSLEYAGAWREVHQAQTEHRPPLKTRRIIHWDYELMQRMTALPEMQLVQRAGWRLMRSLDMYGVALGEWNIYKLLAAAQWLWMAAEGMTELAVPEYLAERGKSEAEVIEEETLRLRHQYMPPKATEQQRAQILQIWDQAGGPPAKLKDQAAFNFKSDARRQIIFKGQPEAYRQLSLASTKFEHGQEGPDQMRLRITPHIDVIAACVRNFILRKLGVDDALFARLTSPPYQYPIPVSDASLNVDARFRMTGTEPAPTKAIPTTDPNGAPFSLRTYWYAREVPEPGMIDPIPHLNETSLFVEGVDFEVLDRRVGYHWEPMSRQAEESGPFFDAMEGRAPKGRP